MNKEKISSESWLESVAFGKIIFKMWQFGNLNPKRWHIGQKAHMKHRGQSRKA
jgi:hypothetical protein